MEKFQVIIAGSRGFDDYDLLRSKCDAFFSRRKPTAIICGEARGADKLGRRYAEENGIEVLSYPAEWSRYGRAAGNIRNAEMLKVADALVAFWDGRSSGTKHMIEITREKNIPYRVVMYLEKLHIPSGVEIR